MDDRPIYNIQTFLGIFKLILAKLIKKKARLEELEISDFRFSYSEYWNTPEKDENHSIIGYTASPKISFKMEIFIQNSNSTKLGITARICQYMG